MFSEHVRNPNAFIKYVHLLLVFRENDSSKNQDNITELLHEITNSSSYLAILTVLAMVGDSIHLSRIARLIGKSKSTTLVHIENLLEHEDPVLEVDEKRTLHTRGTKKYYKLTSMGKRIVELQNQVIDQISGTLPDPDQTIENPFKTKKDLIESVKQESTTLYNLLGEKTLFNYFSLGGELNANIEQMSAAQYITLASRLVKGKDVDETKIATGGFYNFSKQFQITSFDDVIRIQQVVSKFLSDLTKLENQFAEKVKQQIKRGEITEDDLSLQHLYFSMVPILPE